MPSDVATTDNLLQTGTTTAVPGDTNPGPAPAVFFDNFFSDDGGVPADAFNGFVQWTVTGGSVDLVGGTGLGVFGAPPDQPNGRYVDLGGSTGNPGLFQTRIPLPVVAGQTYNLTFNYRSTTGDLDSATATVGDTSFTVSSDRTTFTRFSQDFTADQTGLVTIDFQGDEADIDNSGLGVDGILFGPASDVAGAPDGNAAMPTITGTRGGQTTSAEAPVAPFSGVTLADSNAGATDTLIITLAGSGGTLVGTGLVDNGNGTYTLPAGTPSTVTTALAGLVFTPANTTPGASATTSFTLTDQSSAGANTTDTTTAVTDTAAADAITVDQTVVYDGNGAFTFTGQASSVAGVTGVEFSAVLDGGATQDLGAATLNADGSFTFTDEVGSSLQGFITATLTDGLGQQTDAAFHPALQGGIAGEPYAAREDSYDVSGPDVTYTGSTFFRADGSRVVDIQTSGQTLHSNFFDTFLNHGTPDTTFVFDPGHGLDVVRQFRAGGTDHDTVDLPASDFTSVADVLRHTQNTAGGAVIHDPTSGDTVRLAGVSKAELVANRQDIALHA